MTNVKERDSHATIELLLPWFVNGSLDAGERARVGDHLEGCDACRKAVDVLRKMQLAVRHPDAMPMVPAPRPARLLQSVERQAARRRRVSRLGLVLGVAATVLLGITLGSQLANRLPHAGDAAPYQTLTSDGAAQQMEYVVELGFVSGTDELRRRDVLESLHAQVLPAGADSNTLRVMLRLPAMSLEQLENETRRIESRAEIESARIVAIQLPVQ